MIIDQAKDVAPRKVFTFGLQLLTLELDDSADPALRKGDELSSNLEIQRQPLIVRISTILKLLVHVRNFFKPLNCLDPFSRSDANLVSDHLLPGRVD